jgi:hypothetical protein
VNRQAAKGYLEDRMSHDEYLKHIERNPCNESLDLRLQRRGNGRNTKRALYEFTSGFSTDVQLSIEQTHPSYVPTILPSRHPRAIPAL